VEIYDQYTDNIMSGKLARMAGKMKNNGACLEATNAGATTVRNQVLFLLFLATALNYLGRTCVSAAAPMIMRDLRLSNIQMGYVFGVFAVSYGLVEIPAGWLGDRIGQRKMLTRIVLCWSAFTVCTGAVVNFAGLVLTRFAFGAAEAGAFPSIARALSKWFPASDRGRVTGIIFMGARLGGALAPPLATLLVVCWGWRLTFAVFGAMGFIWVPFFRRSYRDVPSTHELVSEAELEYIRQDDYHSDDNATAGPTPWRRIFFSSNLWALFWMYFGTSYGFWFFLTWLPTSLMRDYRLTASRAGIYAALPLAVGAVTSVTGGLISDRLVRLTGSVRSGRRAVGLVGFLLAGAGFGAASIVGGAVTSVLCLSIASGAMDLAVPVAWAACLEVGGRFGGTTTGFMNTASSLSALLSPIAAAWLFDRFGSFHAMFLSAMAVYWTTGLLWLKIDPSRQVT
jgi:ACS family glucarate transporter-like MFS transporter